jgi:hypothetical protein
VVLKQQIGDTPQPIRQQAIFKKNKKLEGLTDTCPGKGRLLLKIREGPVWTGSK